MDWTLPPGASTFVDRIDPLYYLVLVITGIAFVLVQVLLVWFGVRYRARAGRRARYTHGDTRLEVLWTSVTAVVVVVLGLLSAPTWSFIRGRHSIPAGALPLAVTASQFEWHVTYPGRDARLGTTDDFTLRNQLHVPTGRPVALTLTSEDVIHSFWVPAFRIKQDAVPGMVIRLWFQPTVPGSYELGCAELCGLGHYRMHAAVTVHAPADYDRWLAARLAHAAEPR
jgi:cytochrome c oxidase subunit 2